MRVYLATWAEDNQGEGLSSVGSVHRLMSYFFLERERKDFLADYVTNGKTTRVKGGVDKGKYGRSK